MQVYRLNLRPFPQRRPHCISPLDDRYVEKKIVKCTYRRSKREKQDPIIPPASLKHERSFEEQGEIVVESIEKLSTKPGDLALYRSVGKLPKAVGLNETKLATINNTDRTKSMISPVKQQPRVSFESELTFAPKLNAMSIRLAKERGEKIRAVVERKKVALHAEAESNFTFHPNLSSNSVRIMQNLKTTFLDRQQLHVEKQKRYIEGLLNPQQNKAQLSPVPSSRSPTIRAGSKTTKAKLSDNEGRVSSSLDENVSSSTSFEEVKTMGASTSAVELTALRPTADSSDCSLNISSIEGTSIHSNNSSTTKVEMKASYTKIANNNSIVENKKSTTKVANKNSTQNLEQIEKLQNNSPYNQSVENVQLKRHKRDHKRRATYPQPKATQADQEDGWDDSTKVRTSSKNKAIHTRTSSQSQGTRSGWKLKYDDPVFERVRQAKEVAERAMKNKKVFIINGPYPIVRAALRRRGWVEKHFKGNLVTSKKKKRNEDDDSCDDSCDDDNDDSDSDGPNSCNTSPRGKGSDKCESRAKKDGVISGRNRTRGKPAEDDGSSSDDSDDDDGVEWHEGDWSAGSETGYDCEYSLMSRMVRNAVASFFWTCRRDDIDFKFLRKEQIANHYARAYSFTTKVGLCVNLRNLKWYEDAESSTFFPRCHRIGSDDEKDDFVDDYRLTAAINIVKWVVSRYQFQNENSIKDELTSSSKSDPAPSQPPKSPRKRSSSRGSISRANSRASAISRSSATVLPVRVLTLSLEACRQFISSKEHLDIDPDPKKHSRITTETWEMIVQCFYQITHEGAIIASAYPFLRECQSVLAQMRELLPQTDIDGSKNVWIIKPGAKSRGRGIMCMDRLEDILKLVGTVQGKKEGRWIVQKYIERPLLIYGAKFDIRQWFLVTEWNPLTLWFYKDCYLRFCSQNFTLDNYDVSIHLANNSVQKHYKNGIRDKRLPEDNMWGSDEFQAYMKKRDLGHLWEERVYPGMKQAIIYALEACQEIPEYRKNSFELYGADFMLGEDYKPWLIEINCSPAMSPSTPVTRKLCAQVIEDSMKVVLDRREDKYCDIGRYELAYKQAFISAPPYIGINLAVEGQAIKKSGIIKRQPSTNQMTLARPKENKNVLPSNPYADGSRDSKAEEATRTETTKKRSQVPGESVHKQSSKKPEGHWAVGCMCVGQKTCPVANTYSINDRNSKRQGLIKDSNKDPSQTFVRSPQPMTIPKAVLRYSNDKAMRPRAAAQQLISIGLTTSTKQL